MIDRRIGNHFVIWSHRQTHRALCWYNPPPPFLLLIQNDLLAIKHILYDIEFLSLVIYEANIGTFTNSLNAVYETGMVNKISYAFL